MNALLPQRTARRVRYGPAVKPSWSQRYASGRRRSRQHLLGRIALKTFLVPPLSAVVSLALPPERTFPVPPVAPTPLLASALNWACQSDLAFPTTRLDPTGSPRIRVCKTISRLQGPLKRH